MSRLFGTDGIRGIADQEPVTAALGIRLGRALVRFCRDRDLRPKIIVGRDTRISGKMLENALVSGILSEGGGAVLAGELTTPGVAYLTKALEGGAGVAISASHNPYEYNGFKVFSHEGYKLSEEEELCIEDILSSDVREGGQISGDVQILDDAESLYTTFLQETLPEKHPFKDMKIVLDCANGAAYRVAPVLFERLGAGTDSLFVHPDGKNINDHCGSQHPETLSRRVVETGADAGLAFDGDGDRLIAVDEMGNALTGDQIMIICARLLKERGELGGNRVVSTVMSNMGFVLALKDLGLEHSATKVGDRNVMEEMKIRDAVLGGEESGHIIFLRRHTTGDGILSALHLLWAMKTYGRPLSSLSTWMTRFPQVLINVPVRQKPEISSVPALVTIIREVEEGLGDKGRVLVRYSGTEPLCRVMIEGEKKEKITTYAEAIAEVIGKELG